MWTNVEGKISIRNISGSGFFVNRKGDVVTAQHVVAALGGCIPAIYVPRSGWSFTDEIVDAKWYRISSCDQDATVDIAVCHLVANPFTDPTLHTALEVVKFDISTQPEGAPVAFTSFALNDVHPITSVGIVAGYFWENHRRFLLVDKGAGTVRAAAHSMRQTAASSVSFYKPGCAKPLRRAAADMTA